MNAAFLSALWAAKFSKILLTLTGHSGTNHPGEIALKICPDFLKYIEKPNRIIAVTGTNGKTTVTNLICDMLQNDGLHVLNNREGSNINTGIASCLIKGSTLFGKSKYETCVLEIDERSAPRIYPYLHPDYLIITNLFRDSVMRNPHPAFIADILSNNIPAKTKLICNAEDLISLSVAPQNDRVTFGIDRLPSDLNECKNLVNDIRVCPKCGTALSYEFVRYHHIGRVYCTKCGFRSPHRDYCVCKVDYEHACLEIHDKEGNGLYKLLNDSTFNIYNVAAVVALFRELGYNHNHISELLQHVSIPETRYKEVQIGKITLVLQAAKETNAIASTMALSYMTQRPGKKSVLLMMNSMYDEKYWSENICWMYDCDFEVLNDPSIEQIVVAGPRYLDYRLRLLIAGIAPEKILYTRDEKEAAERIEMQAGESIYILHGMDSQNLYSEVLEILKKRAGEIKDEG